MLTSDAGSSSDEARTHLTEHTDGDAAITTLNGEPIAPQHVEVSVPTESHLVFDRTPVLHHGSGATAMNDGAAPRSIEQVRALEGDVRSTPAHTTSESHSETGSNARSNHESNGRWNARHDDSRNDSDRHDTAMAIVIRTQANPTMGTSTEAAPQISGPPRLPVKCLARGLPASLDPENHSTSRIPFGRLGRHQARRRGSSRGIDQPPRKRQGNQRTSGNL